MREYSPLTLTDLRDVSAATTHADESIDAAEDDGRRIRGLFSASQIAHQLGMELQTFEVARSFADIEAALVR